MVTWIPGFRFEDEEVVALSGGVGIGNVRRTGDGRWRWEFPAMPGLSAALGDRSGTCGTRDEAKARVEGMWGEWLAMAGVPKPGAAPADGRPGRVFLGSFATFDEFECERDSDGFTMHDLALPNVQGVFSSRERAVEVTKEVALSCLRTPYEDQSDGDADFLARIDLGYWVDEPWTVPEGGRPGSVHRYRNDGELLAIVLVQEAEVED